jgi:hypothetical protein
MLLSRVLVLYKEYADELFANEKQIIESYQLDRFMSTS